MKTKLEMAHDMAMAIQSTKLIHDMELVSQMAWKYADAMQAEAKKREDKSRPDVLQDGFHNCTFSNKTDTGVLFQEWQPDWSQAPDWANWWVKTPSGETMWCGREPVMLDDYARLFSCGLAPSFGYQGDWKSSLRKRP